MSGMAKSFMAGQGRYNGYLARKVEIGQESASKIPLIREVEREVENDSRSNAISCQEPW
jgi:hypothetical protein